MAVRQRIDSPGLDSADDGGKSPSPSKKDAQRNSLTGFQGLMKVYRERPEHNLRVKVILEVRRLVAEIVFLAERFVKVRKAHELFKFVQPRQRDLELEVEKPDLECQPNSCTPTTSTPFRTGHWRLQAWLTFPSSSNAKMLVVKGPLAQR